MSAGRVLLTGATGPIGRQMGDLLRAKGYDVVPVSRKPGCLIGDLQRDPEGIVVRAEADHLIHLGWHDGPDHWQSADNLNWVGASLRLLRAFAEFGGTRAVMVGSCAEYDWSGGRLSETTTLKPTTLYGTTKAATGMAALAAAPVLGVSLAWARPFFCYGPGEPPGRLFGDLIRGLKAGGPVDCVEGRQKRDFLHSEDVAGALAALLVSPVEGAINIGSGKAVAVRDMILTAARLMKCEDRVRLGALPQTDVAPKLVEADVTRLTREVGFKPRYDIGSGITAVLEAEALV